MSDITVDFAQYSVDTTLNGPYSSSDNVTLADDSSILDALTTGQIDALSTNNVDVISATDGVLSWDADQFSHFILGTIAIDPDTFAILADTGANIAALTASQIAAIAAEGVAALNPTDSTLTLAVDQFNALGAMNVDSSADFTIADTGANLAGMSAGQIGSLGILGVDHLDATNDVLSLTVAQYQALGTVTLAAGDTVTLADTGANLNGLSLSDYTNLHDTGIDVIDATDNAFSLSLAEYNALNGTTLTAGDTVTLADTGANIGGLTTGQIDALSTAGIDVFDATDNAVTLSAAQITHIVSGGITLAAGDTVTLADTGATLGGLSTGTIDNYAAIGVDVFDATDDAVTFSVAQYNTIVSDGISLVSGDAVTISDTAANIITLDPSSLAAAHVDYLDATTALTTLGVADFTALGTVAFTSASAVTLTDTGANIAGVSDFSTFASHGVDTLDASDNTLTISEAQFQALGTTTLTGADTVTISDTGANIVGGPNYGTLAGAGVDFLNATTAINITVNDITNLGTVHFTSGSAVTLTDTGAHIAAVADFTTFGTHGVDTIDATNNTLTINTTQFGGLGSVTLTAGDTVTISDTAANLSGLTFSGLAAANVDTLNSTDAYTTLTVQNLTDLGVVRFSAGSSVTLTDTAAHIQAVSDFTTFATHGVDTIKSSDNALTVNVAQLDGLGTARLTGSDDVTLADTAANLSSYLDGGSHAQQVMQHNDVDTIHATEGSITVDIAAIGNVIAASAVFAAGDTVTLADTGANLAAVSFSTFAGIGIDIIDATDDVLTITRGQYVDAAGSVAFTASDLVTVADTASIIGGLTTGQIGGLSTNLIDALSITSGGDLDWSVAQWQALPGSVSVSDSGGSLVVSDSEANIEALTGTDLGALATSGAQILHATEGTLNFTASQAEGFLGTSLVIASGDTGTLVDTGANVGGMTATQIGQLAAAGFDTIDTSDNSLTLSVAQFSGLGTTLLTGADAVTLADTASNLNTYLDAVGTQAALSNNGVDTIHATGGSISVDAAAFGVVNGAGAVFASGDAVTLADTGANIAALDFTTLSPTGIDTLDASDGALTITAAQYLDIAGTVALTAADTVTIADTAANIEALTAVQIGALDDNFVDAISITSGGDLDWSVAQWQALAVSVSDSGGSLVVSDSEANIEALTGTDLGALASSGAQILHATEGTLNFTASQAEGFLGTSLVIASGDTGTLVDTGANVAGMTATQIGQLAAAGFDTVDTSDNTLTLDVSQLSALGTVHVAGGDALTLADTASNLNTFLDGGSASTILLANGVDTIHATGGTISVDAAAISHVSGTGAAFATGDTVTLADTGANIAALNFSYLPGLNVDTIDASDNTLSISLTQYEAIAGTVALTAGDTVTVTGNLDGLSTVEIAGFGTNHVDHLLDQDGFNEVIWNVAQWNALDTSLTIDNSAHIAGLNFVFDSAANLSAVTATQVANFVAEGAQTWEESPAGDSTLVTWTVANTEAMGGSAFSDGTYVNVVDSAANIEAVSDFSIFAAHKIDAIDSTDDTLSLTVAQFSGLGTTTLTGADAVTLADTATNLVTYLAGTGVGAALSANGVDTIHATGGTIGVSAADIGNVAGSGAVFATGDTVAFSDTGANIAAADFSVLAGLNVDLIDATDNTLSISLAQYEAIAGTVALTAGDTVTVTGNLDGLSTVEIAGFATNNVDHLLDVDGFNEVIWNVAQWNALTTAVTIDNGAHIAGSNFVFDSGANLSAVTAAQIADFVTEGAEIWEGNPPDSESVTWTVAKLNAMGSSVWQLTDVTIADTAVNLQAVSDYTIFAAHGIDTIDSTDDTLSLTAAQFGGLGSTVLTGSDVVTLADTAANIEAMGTDGYTAMASGGVDFIHATDTNLTVTYAELNAIISSSIKFQAGDHVTLTGTQAELFDSQSGTFFSDLGTVFNIDEVSITGGTASLNLSQWNGLVAGGVTIDATNDVTLTDTAANLASVNAAGIAAMAGQIDHWDASDSSTLVLNISQLDALSTATIALTTSDTVELADAEATIEGLGAGALQGYIEQGVDIVHASDTSTLDLSRDKVLAVVDHGAQFLAGDDVTLTDTAANIGLLSAAKLGELVSGHVDHITATGGTLDLDVGQFQAVETALHDGTLTLTNPAHLFDTGANLDGLTVTEIGQLEGDNFSQIGVTGDLTWSKAQIDALGTVAVVTTGNFILADTEAHIEALTTGQIDGYAGIGLDVLHSTDVGDTLHFTAGQASHILSGSLTVDNTTVTVTDTGSNISGLSSTDLGDLSGAGFTGIVDASGDVTWNVAQAQAVSVDLSLASGADLILSDAQATIEALTAGDLGDLIASPGVTEITASDTHTLNLSAAQIETLFGAAVFASGDTVTLVDTASTINALTTTQIGDLSTAHVDAIDASDNAVTWSVAQFGALNGVTFTAGDLVTLADTGANLATLDFSALAAANVDALDATDNVLTLTVADYTDLGSVTLAAGDAVTISDTAAHVTALDFSTLAAAHIDVLDISDAFSLSVARYQSMGAVTFSSASNITLADTGANLAALTAIQIGQLATNGIDTIDATNDSLNITVAQYNALGSVALTTGDTVVISDTGANLATLDFSTLATHHVDRLNATNDTLTITVSQYQSLNGVLLTGGDVVTLRDTGANLAALTANQISQLAGNGIDKLDASNNVLTLSVAQFSALGTVTLTGGDTVTLFDTGANLQALNFSTLQSKGVDILDASDNVLTLTAAQFAALGTVALKSTDTVTLLDTGADISALTTGQFNALAAKGIDILDATDNAYSLTIGQISGLGVLTLATNDTVSVTDTEANIEAATGTNFANMVAKSVDFIHATNSTDNVTVSQITPLLGSGTAFAGGDTVTLVDTGANISALTSTQIGQLAGAGIDTINASNDTLTLSLAQYRALGTVTLTGADTVTIQNDNGGISGMTVSEIQALKSNGIDVLESTNGNFSFSVVQAEALLHQTGGGTVSLTGGDIFYINDTAANVATLSAADITALGALGAGSVDLIASGALALTVDQYTAAVAASVAIDSGDNVTLTDTSANIAALTSVQFGALAGNGIDHIDATDDTLTISVAQFQGLGAVTLATGDTVTVSDTAVNIQALSNSDLAAMVSNHVDVISATGGSLTVTVAQVGALLGASTHFDLANTVTLADSGATISALGAIQIGVLAAAGIDTIDATDNVLTLSVAQYNALGTVTLTGGDTVTLQDANSTINALTASQIQALKQGGIDVLKTAEHSITFTVAQAEALLHQTGGGSLGVAATETLYISDTAANIGTLSTSDLTALGTLGAGAVDLIATGTLTVDLAHYNAAATAGITFDAGDTVVLADVNNNLHALSVGQISALAGNGVDSVHVTDARLVLSVAQLNAFGAVALTQSDTVWMVDGQSAIQALTGVQITNYATQGVDIIRSTSGTLNMNASQVSAVLAASLAFQDGNNVTLSDTGGNIAGLSSTQIGQLAGKGVDHIDATNNTLTLNIDQFHALGVVTLAAGDTNTITDSFINFLGMSTADIANLDDQHITHLHSTDGAKGFQWSIDRWNALPSGITIDSASGAVSIFDTGSNEQGLTVTQINNFHTAGLNTIVVNGGTVNYSVAQTSAILSDSIGIVNYANSAIHVATVSDTGANLATLTTGQIGALYAAGYAAIDASDDAVTLTKAQLDALATGTINLTAGDTVTLADLQATVEGLSASAFASYITQGVDVFASNGGALTLDASQVAAVVDGNASFRGSDTVTLSDTAAHIGGLTSTEFGALGASGVDSIAITAGTLLLSVADYQALGTFSITGGTVTLTDTGANLATLTDTELAALTGTAINHIDATNNAVSFTIAQLDGLFSQTYGGSVTFDGTDTVTVSDTGADIAAKTAGEFTALGGNGAAGVILDASDNVLGINIDQYNAIVAASIALTAGDTVTLADTGANLATLTTGNIAALSGVDAVHATDGSVSFDIAQLNALQTASIALTTGDAVTLADTVANIQGLSALALTGYGTQLVDYIHATDGALVMSEAQIAAVTNSTIAFASGDTVTLSDTGANIAALTSTQFGALSSHGVDTIDATDNVLSLTAAQYHGLASGSTTIAAGDVVTLSDTGANIAGLSSADFTAMAAHGIDTIDSSTNLLSLTVAQYQGLSTVTLTGSDAVTLADTGTNIAALSASDIGALAGNGIDAIDASNNALTLSVDQFNALGTVTLASGDAVTLSGTGSQLASQNFATLASKGVDKIDATDNTLSLTVAQYTSLGSITLTGNDTVTLSDTGANIASLTASQIGALTASGVDAINASDNAITLSLAQYTALGSLTLAANDVLTIQGTSGTDLVTGTTHADIIYGYGGDDVLLGGNGNDVLDGGSGNNTLNGGSGGDTVSYATATRAVSVNLTTNTANNGAGTDTLVSIENITGSNFSDTLTGNSGNNVVSAGSGNDTLHLETGGNDTGSAGDGNDKIYMGGALTASDKLDGGTGNDFVYLDGDYSTPVAFTATTMTNVEHLVLAGGHSYSLTTANATVASGALFYADASALGAGDSFTFNGAAEADGRFVITGGAGNDSLTGGTGADTFYLTGGGNDTVVGGNGNDKIYLGASLTSADHIDGGAATDVVNLDGDYSAGVTFGAATLTNVEQLVVTAGHSYNLTTDDGNLASGKTMTVDGSALGSSDSFVFNGSAEINGHLHILGGAGNDTLTAGASSDQITGGAGTDSLTGGAGADKFYFTLGDGNDTITDFTAQHAGHDIVSLAGYGISDFATLQTHMAQVGADTVITFDVNNHITLHNVTATDLSAADFIFTV